MEDGSWRVAANGPGGERALVMEGPPACLRFGLGDMSPSSKRRHVAALQIGREIFASRDLGSYGGRRRSPKRSWDRREAGEGTEKENGRQGVNRLPRAARLRILFSGLPAAGQQQREAAQSGQREGAGFRRA